MGTRVPIAVPLRSVTKYWLPCNYADSGNQIRAIFRLTVGASDAVA